MLIKRGRMCNSDPGYVCVCVCVCVRACGALVRSENNIEESSVQYLKFIGPCIISIVE